MINLMLPDRFTRLVLAAGPLLVLMLSDCGSPLSITDCHDQYGRGGTAPNILKVSCTPAGLNVQCVGIADNSPASSCLAAQTPNR
jgi:hypothetical protein